MTITARLLSDPALHTDTASGLAARYGCSTASVSTARRISRDAARAAGKPVPTAKAGRRPSAHTTERTRRIVAIERADVVAWLRSIGLGEAADRVEAGEHVGARKT